MKNYINGMIMKSVDSLRLFNIIYILLDKIVNELVYNEVI